MILSNLNSLIWYLPELTLLLTSIAVLIFDLFGRLRPYNAYLPYVGLIRSGIFLFIMGPSYEILFEGMIVNDSFSYFFKCIFLVSAFMIILLSSNTEKIKNVNNSEYNMMLIIITIGLFLMCSANNLVIVYIGVELVSLPSYILSGILKNDEKSNEASLKYVIFGSFASGLMLFGISWLYGLAGSTDFSIIHRELLVNSNPMMIYLTILLIMAGFGYKISMAPFHYWTPDVYEGSPTPVTAFFSVAPKAAGIALILRFIYSIFTVKGSFGNTEFIQSISWPQIMAIISAVTMTMGNLLAIQQSNVKRMLAYSSIAHVGYMLMAFTVLSSDAILAVLLYVFIYFFMNLAAFFFIVDVSNNTGTSKLSDYKGYASIAPISSAFMVITLVSLAGLPPMSGFIGKFYLFSVLFRESSFYWLAVIGILNSVVSLYYYFLIVKNMYLEKPSEKLKPLKPNKAILYSLIIFSSQNLLFYLYWTPLVEYFKRIVS
ncbi:MAG: hypothetical protein CBD58_00645 [bacterium TMED198]|nr:MAG: hypothetical protein CBD58_00645 [bacterium TMED198]